MACPRINTGYVGGWDFPPAWYFLRAQAFLLFINSPFLFPNISSYYITEGAARPLSGVISVLHHPKTKSTKTREETINWTAPVVTVEPKAPNNHRSRAFSEVSSPVAWGKKQAWGARKRWSKRRHVILAPGSASASPHAGKEEIKSKPPHILHNKLFRFSTPKISVLH